MGWYNRTVDYLSVMHAGFLDELEKIAVSRGRTHVPKERSGRRSMSVTTLLRKEKDGTLYKTKEGGDISGSLVPFTMGQIDPSEAQRPKKKGEVPSKEDFDAAKRMDGRGEATTVTGIGQTFNNIAATGNSVGGT